MMSKKAQSEIITTVLIILLVLAAIVIVWQVVNSTVRSGGEGITQGAACIEVSVDVVKANSTGYVTVTRRSGGTGALSNVILLVDGKQPTTATNVSTKALGPLDSVSFTEVTGLDAAGKTVKAAGVLVDGTVCDTTGESLKSTLA